MKQQDITLDALMSPGEVAEYRGVSVKALTQERYRGTGPRFVRDGRRIRYRAKDVAAWIDANTVTR